MSDSDLPLGWDDFCPACHRATRPNPETRDICRCNGIQTYAYSTYPGGSRLVRSHPDNSDAQWYSRKDIDPLIERLRHAEVLNESDSVVGSCSCLTKTAAVSHHARGCRYRLICERDDARSRLDKAVKTIAGMRMRERKKQ